MPSTTVCRWGAAEAVELAAEAVELPDSSGTGTREEEEEVAEAVPLALALGEAEAEAGTELVSETLEELVLLD